MQTTIIARPRMVHGKNRLMDVDMAFKDNQTNREVDTYLRVFTIPLGVKNYIAS